MMYIPDSISLNARDIKIEKSFNKPFSISEKQVMEPDGSVTTKQMGLYGYYDPNALKMYITENSDNPSYGESLFFHELVEAIDVHGDFGLDHGSITTLGNNLHQVFNQILDFNLKMHTLSTEVVQ